MRKTQWIGGTVMDNEDLLRNRIINLREQNNWTQAQLAKKTGLDNTKLSKIENGARRVASDELNKFAEVFDVSSDYLLGRDEPKKTPHYTSADLDEMLNNAMSFDGKPMTEHDKEVIRAYLEGKFGSNQ